MMGKYLHEGNGAYVLDDGTKFKVDGFVRIDGIHIIGQVVAFLDGKYFYRLEDQEVIIYVQPYIQKLCPNGIEYLDKTYCIALPFSRVRNVPEPVFVECACDEFDEGHLLYRPFVGGFSSEIDESWCSDRKVAYSEMQYLTEIHEPKYGKAIVS